MSNTPSLSVSRLGRTPESGMFSRVGTSSKYFIPSRSAEAPTMRQVMGRLVWLRMIANLAQVAVLLLVLYGLRIELYVWPLVMIILGLWLMNMLVRWRLSWPMAVTELEIVLQLGLDMLGLAGLMYWSGGSTNPFVSLFLVPVAIAAAFLRVRYVVVLVILGAGFYSLLLRYYVPLAPVGARFGGDFNLHVLGMWANFILSSIIAAIFVYKLARSGRESERKLAQAHNAILRNEHIVSVGAMAAGTAHEMNTPLATIALLADELINGADDTPQVREDAQEIARQVMRCQEQLGRLQSVADSGAASLAGEWVPLASYIDGILGDWGAMRSDIAISTKLELPDAGMLRDTGLLAQAITNLLNNAAEASLENGQARVAVAARVEGNLLCLDIDDFGPGLSTAQLRMAGKAAFTSKQRGLGLGLVLSHSTLENRGGAISLTNRESGGLRAEVRVPLENPD